MAYSPPYSLRGSGKPLVFQHGLGASRLQIEELLTSLSGIQLLTADVPGHGSHILQKSFTPSFDRYTDEMIRIMDLAGIDKAVAGGLSMGAGIAANLACRYPQRVAGLILLRPAWYLSSTPDNLQILLDVAAHIESREISLFESSPKLKAIREKVPEAADSILGMFEREQPDATATLLRNMVNDKPCPSDISPLHKLPTLIIGNDQDPLHPWSMAEAWHELLPQSTLVKVSSRYSDRHAHQQEVNRAIRDFMNNLTIN
jgi:pimeloyl-ACP methyl ester carboxylesterase